MCMYTTYDYTYTPYKRIFFFLKESTGKSKNYMYRVSSRSITYQYHADDKASTRLLLIENWHTENRNKKKSLSRYAQNLNGILTVN